MKSKAILCVLAAICLLCCDADADTFTMTFRIYGQSQVWLHDAEAPPNYVLDTMSGLEGDVDVKWSVSRSGFGLITFDSVSVDVSDLGGFGISVSLDESHRGKLIRFRCDVDEGATADNSVWDSVLDCPCEMTSDMLGFSVIASEWMCGASWQHDDTPDDSVFKCEY